jgi:hypothetical protein
MAELTVTAVGYAADLIVDFSTSITDVLLFVYIISLDREFESNFPVNKPLNPNQPLNPNYMKNDTSALWKTKSLWHAITYIYK